MLSGNGWIDRDTELDMVERIRAMPEQREGQSVTAKPPPPGKENESAD